MFLNQHKSITINQSSTRNDIIFNKGKFIPIQIIKKAQHQWSKWETAWDSASGKSYNELIIEDILATKNPDDTPFTNANSQAVTYLLSNHPNVNYIITVDGSFSNSKQGSYGVAALDQTGSIILEYSHRLTKQIDSALLPEALAMEQALILASLKGWDNFVVLSDSRIIIDYVNDTYHLSYIDWAIYPILCSILRMSRNFKNLSFAFIPRSCNILAHNLAKQTASMSNSCKFPAVC